jgi:hypothetical protein
MATKAKPTKKKTAPKASGPGVKKSKSTKAAPAKKAAAPREGSKQEMVVALMRRKEGVTLEAIMQATGWQKHTVRGFVSGMVGKKLGLKVESANSALGERTYSIQA